MKLTNFNSNTLATHRTQGCLGPCRESEELTLSFIHIDIVSFIHSILVYCVRIDVIISVLRQRDKASPGFCIPFATKML